jgi:hypothetical protein
VRELEHHVVTRRQRSEPSRLGAVVKAAAAPTCSTVPYRLPARFPSNQLREARQVSIPDQGRHGCIVPWQTARRRSRAHHSSGSGSQQGTAGRRTSPGQRPRVIPRRARASR